jgi:6-phosphogluconolactonase
MTDVISITRRGLMIGGSVVAGAVAATSSAKRALAQGGPTERLAYVGCYTPPGEGIVLYRVNADTGAMTQVKVFSGISNPSWIALDPLHRVLYAVNEDEPSGGVSAFTVDHASGDLKLINKVDSHGKWPCHLSVHPSGKFVLVANYGTGNVSVFPILANGGLGDPPDTESDTGALNPPKAADNPPGNFAPSDHTGPKMHMIQTDPSGQFVIAKQAS